MEKVVSPSCRIRINFVRQVDSTVQKTTWGEIEVLKLRKYLDVLRISSWSEWITRVTFKKSEEIKSLRGEKFSSFYEQNRTFLVTVGEDQKNLFSVTVEDDLPAAATTGIVHPLPHTYITTGVLQRYDLLEEGCMLELHILQVDKGKFSVSLYQKQVKKRDIACLERWMNRIYNVMLC